jgi:hypothetical protein
VSEFDETYGSTTAYFYDAAYSALRKLSSGDFGHDKRKWLAWWYRNRHDVVD